MNGKKIPLTQTRKIPRVMSDHNPLIVDTGEKPMIKSAEFRSAKRLNISS
jgi:hypothetical protein